MLLHVRIYGTGDMITAACLISDKYNTQCNPITSISDFFQPYLFNLGLVPPPLVIEVVSESVYSTSDIIFP